MLVQTGIAKTFWKFSPELLNALTIKQLRDIAEEAELEKTGATKASIIEKLDVLPAPVLKKAWKVANVNPGDIFKLIPILQK